MKKLFVAAMVFAVAVMATGCIQGTVKRVGIRYSYADTKCDKIITKGVTHYAACGEKGNLLLAVSAAPGYPVILGGGIDDVSAIKSDSAGIWIDFMAGSLVNPNPASCSAFKANTYCEGVVRICGTGTWSKNKDNAVYGTFTGSGKFIVMESGATELCGTGKLYDPAMDSDNCYKGVMNISITPGYAYLVEVEDGNVISTIPVQATISLPCIPFWNTVDSVIAG